MYFSISDISNGRNYIFHVTGIFVNNEKIYIIPGLRKNEIKSLLKLANIKEKYIEDLSCSNDWYNKLYVYDYDNISYKNIINIIMIKNNSCKQVKEKIYIL